MTISAGVYAGLSNSFNDAVAGTVIDPSDWNDLFTDIETALNAALSGTSSAGKTDVASGTICNIGAATTFVVRITGTTSIASLGTVAYTRKLVYFSGILQLTHDATALILPTGANITTAAGDCGLFVSDASGNWRCFYYMPVSGAAINGANVVGPGSAVSGRIATFSGTSGKIIQDGSATISTDGTFAANSDAKVPTEKAVKTYAQPLDSELTAIAGLLSAADRVPYFTGSGTATLATFTSAGRSMVGAADAAAQTALLNAFTGDSGAGGAKGLVPAPASGDAAASKFLKADGTWTSPSGSGDVVGGSASTDGEVVLYNGTGGKTIKRSNGISGIAKLASGVLSAATAGTDYMKPNTTSVISAGFTLSPNNLGNITSFTIDPSLGNYQYGTNHGAATWTAPTSDCAVDILVVNDASAGSITFSGFTVGSATGSPLTTINTNKFVISIRRLNSVSTYSVYALQ